MNGMLVNFNMLFTSLTFLAVFLPIVLTASWILLHSREPRRPRIALSNAILLLSSLLFYFWGEGRGILLLCACIAANFLFALTIDGARRQGDRKILVVAAIVIDLAALAVFKYADFATRGVNTVFGTKFHELGIALPLGISFFTFQAMSYVIDVYRRDVRATRSLVDFGCYISMFPQLVAGPIVRYSDIERSLRKRHTGLLQVSSGMRRFLAGLARKVLIANVAGDFADRAWAFTEKGMGIHPAYAWLALSAYTLQIYHDFAGYSDMAIGIGRMLGFNFPENFNLPYTSKSVREFWRRWHISLSTWFRDYLYIPLGGSRCSTARACINNLAVFALCGLWHGASVMFLAWGVWHGLLIVAERLAPDSPLSRTRAGGLLGYARTMAAVALGWVLFRSQTPDEAWLFIRSLAGSASIAPETRLLAVDAHPLLFASLAVGALLASGLPWHLREWASRRVGSGRRAAFALAEWCAVSASAAIALLSIAGGSYNPFIYFRF